MAVFGPGRRQGGRLFVRIAPKKWLLFVQTANQTVVFLSEQPIKWLFFCPSLQERGCFSAPIARYIVLLHPNRQLGGSFFFPPNRLRRGYFRPNRRKSGRFVLRVANKMTVSFSKPPKSGCFLSGPPKNGCFASRSLVIWSISTRAAN